MTRIEHPSRNVIGQDHQRKAEAEDDSQKGLEIGAIMGFGSLFVSVMGQPTNRRPATEKSTQGDCEGKNADEMELIRRRSRARVTTEGVTHPEIDCECEETGN